jgi:hypothetical protein
MRQVVDVAETGDRRDRRRGTGGDDDLVGGQGLAVHRHVMGPGEPGHFLNGLDVRQLGQDRLVLLVAQRGHESCSPSTTRRSRPCARRCPDRGSRHRHPQGMRVMTRGSRRAERQGTPAGDPAGPFQRQGQRSCTPAAVRRPHRRQCLHADGSRTSRTGREGRSRSLSLPELRCHNADRAPSLRAWTVSWT